MCSKSYLNKLIYSSLDHNTTFGDGLEEITLLKVTVIIQIEKFECFKKQSIDTHFGRCFEFKFIGQLSFETKLSRNYDDIVVDVMMIYFMNILTRCYLVLIIIDFDNKK